MTVAAHQAEEILNHYFAENCGQLLSISTLYFEGPKSEMKAFFL
jgi:hypothetical protein